MMLTRTMGLSALLTASAAGLALARTPQAESLTAGALGLAALAAGLSLREMGTAKAKPEHAALLLMVQALVMTEGLCRMTATRGF
jgi:hypothetical protein